MPRLSFLPILLTGCAAAAVPPAPSPTPSSSPLATPAPSPASSSSTPRYAAVFDDLVARIERDHVFPPHFERDVGHPWRDDVPRLREEFLRATNRQEALGALAHLQNSLRDVHCWLDPPAGMHRRGIYLGLGLWAGGTATKPDVRVAKVLDPDVKNDVAPGDSVISVDGEPIAAWIADHPFESSWLAPLPALEDIVDRIGRAASPWAAVHDGEPRVLGIARDGKSHDVTFHFHRSFAEAEPPSLDAPPPMASVDCDASSPAAYGDYRLTSMGVNVCIYEPVHPGKPRIPIVRYVSFLYESQDPAQALRMVKTDHDLLAKSLRDADAVVLDVHENGGGNNPFVFLRWFSKGPWDHERVVTRVVPGLDEGSVNELLWGDETAVKGYLNAQQTGRPTVDTRFLCTDGHCVGDVGAASEMVTRAPVTLVVGPDCVSSCDTLALTWGTFHLGRLVGQQPAHAYTVHRLPIHVSGPESEDLGTFRIAISHSELKDGVSIEGEPLALDWEAPHTFDTRETWVRDAVTEARKRVVRP